MTTNASCRLQADAIIVSSQRILTPGQLVIRHGRIVEVTPHTRDTADIVFHDSVLLPGLINAHTHLEFSQLRQPLPAGENFPDWIRAVFAMRQAASDSVDTRYRAIQTGLGESAACGVAALGDIVTAPWQPAMLTSTETQPADSCWNDLSAVQLAKLRQHLPASTFPQVVAFIEQLGLHPERQAPLVAWREELLAASPAQRPERLLALGLSPHAPYSTPAELWLSLASQASSQGQTLAMHVLESPAEREWLDGGTGPMFEFLSQLGAGDFRQPAGLIEQLCAHCRDAPSTLLVHGNYLNQAELDCIADSPNISLVYCPRTHQHFQHQSYPVTEIIQRRIRLLLGTDSRSTNPDLNVWQEARTALQLHSALQPSQALDAITQAAATALRIADDFGSLQPGRVAALNIIRPAPVLPKQPESIIERLFDTSSAPQLLSGNMISST